MGYHGMGHEIKDALPEFYFMQHAKLPWVQYPRKSKIHWKNHRRNFTAIAMILL